MISLQRILGSRPAVRNTEPAAASVGGNVAASGLCQMYSDRLIGILVIAEVTCSGQFWFVIEF